MKQIIYTEPQEKTIPGDHICTYTFKIQPIIPSKMKRRLKSSKKMSNLSKNRY